MTTLAQKERLRDLRSALDIAKNWRRSYEPAWTDYYNTYTGRLTNGPVRSCDEVWVNIAFATVRVVMASTTLGASPKWQVRPRRPYEGARARLHKALLETWWERLGAHREMSAATLDAAVIGHGWVKTSWDYADVQAEEPDQALIEFMLANIARLRASGAPEEQLPSDEEVRRFATKKSVRVLRDDPKVERVSPWLVWVDPEATHPDRDARWIAELSIQSWDEVRRNDRFVKSAREAVEPTMRSKFDMQVFGPFQDRMLSDVLKRVLVWTMWDVERREVTMWAEGHEEKPLWGPAPVDDGLTAGHPLRMISAFPVNDELYPMGFVELIAPAQTEYNQIRREMSIQRRMARDKFLVRRRAMSDEFREALEDDKPFAILPVEDDDLPLDNVLVRLPAPQINSDLFNIGALILRDIDRTTGVTAYEQGVSTGFRTATEVQAIIGYAGARAEEFRERFRGTMRAIGTDLIGLARKNITMVNWVRLQTQFGIMLPMPPKERLDELIFDTDENQMYYPFTGEDLAGQFEYDVDLATGPDAAGRVAAEANQLAQVMLPFVQLGVADPVELARTIATAFGVVDVDALVPPSEGPVTMPGETSGIPSAPAPGSAPPSGGGPPLDVAEIGRQSALERERLRAVARQR